MSRSIFILSTAACCALAACAPSTDGTTDVVVLAYQPNLGRYDRAVVQLTTIDDLVALKGSVAEVVGGAEIDFDVSSVDKLFGDKGGAVKADFIDVDGVLVPADFHSLNMVTAYYNLERAALFFEANGLNLHLYGKKTLYYFPEVTLLGEQMKDNAFFSSILGGFAVLPFDEFQQIPLAINLGIMGHEFSHSVFNHYVCDSDPYCLMNDPTYASNEAVNVLTAFDEGIADFMGAAITCGEAFTDCDPRFMEPSMPEAYASTRDLSRRWCYSSETRSLLKGDVNTFYQEGHAYILGTVLSSALWRAVDELDATAEVWQLVAGGVLSALQDVSTHGIRGLGEAEVASGRQGSFVTESASHLTVANALNAIASKMNNSVKPAVCAAFLDRFHLSTKDLPECLAFTSFGQCSNRSIGGAP